MDGHVTPDGRSRGPRSAVCCAAWHASDARASSCGRAIPATSLPQVASGGDHSLAVCQHEVCAAPAAAHVGGGASWGGGNAGTVPPRSAPTRPALSIELPRDGSLQGGQALTAPASHLPPGFGGPTGEQPRPPPLGKRESSGAFLPKKLEVSIFLRGQRHGCPLQSQHAVPRC